MSKRTLSIATALALLVGLLSESLAVAQNGQPVSTRPLRRAVTLEGIEEHLRAFQAIADANDDNRAAATPGYAASVDYVADHLRDANYRVRIHRFAFDFFAETAEPVLDLTDPDRPAYTTPEDFLTMQYSGSGDVTGQVVPTNDVQIPPPAQPGSTSGCEPEDFPGEVSGNIALIQRGTCTFEQKAANAQAAGAVGVVIFNEGQEGRTDAIAGTLGRPFDIPIVGASFAVGTELYQLSQRAGGATVRLFTETINEERSTVNVLGDTRFGNPRRTIVVGAHLDSTLEGPGINDNSTGVGGILEVAEEMHELGLRTRNRVRFAFWGAEEAGLFGSQAYVDSLNQRQLGNIEAYLNFDMIGSPNFVRFVYDGNGSDSGIPGPRGSKRIEDIFNGHFSRQGLETEPTPLDGRSDYVAFMFAGIAVGGLFTGAEGIKTEEQEDIYGGEAGEPYDPCYHTPCDTLQNVNRTALDQMSDGLAHTVLRMATRPRPLP